jgi:hypothetical protein
MSAVKDLIVKLIKKPMADAVVKKYHYSGKVTQNSQLSFGVFKDGVLVGAAQFGPSIDKRRMGQSLGIGMNESLELNRLAISDKCGKNSESRVLGICIRFIKKKYPHIKCIISFADACQCGDGIIYRASGFKLESFKKNNSLFYIPDNVAEVIKKYIPTYKGGVISSKALNNVVDENGKHLTTRIKKLGAKPLTGYQMKYIYYIDKEIAKKHKNVPFDKIPKEVKMYKGVKRGEHESNATDHQSVEGGAIPTSTLHSKVGD